MPIDPSIPLRATAPQTPSMGDLLGGAMQMRVAKDEMEERRRRREESDAVQQAFSDAGGDPRKALPGVMSASPTTGLALQKSISDTDASDIQLKIARLNHDSLVTSKIANAFAAVEDDDQQGWDQAISSLKASGIDTSRIPTVVSNKLRDYYFNQAVGYKEAAELEIARLRAKEPKVVGDNLVDPSGKVLFAGKKQDTRDLRQQALEALRSGDLEEYRKIMKVAKDYGDNTRDQDAGQGSGSAGASGDFAKTGEEFLSTIPQNWRRLVKQIGDYMVDPNRAVAARGGSRERVMQWVAQYNPAYDSSLFSNRAPTRRAYTTGTQGQQITALNTAIGHLDQLASLTEQLNNSSFTPANRVWNELRQMFGDAAPTNFETLKESLAAEVDAVMSKGAATVSGRQAAKEQMHNASSPQQLAGYVRTLIPLLGSRLSALDYAYHQAMGADDPFKALSGPARSVLEKYGFDPDDPIHHGNTEGPIDQKTGASARSASSQGSLRTPSITVPKEAEQFLRNAPPNTILRGPGGVRLTLSDGKVMEVK